MINNRLLQKSFSPLNTITVNKQSYKYNKEQDFIFTVQAQAGRYKYKFQGQERQEDLDLGWDSFKYRNYDYAIGRFFNVDPLAEKFPYNGIYNFSENRVVDAVELEGLEAETIYDNPYAMIEEGFAEIFRATGRIFDKAIASVEAFFTFSTTNENGSRNVSKYQFEVRPNFESFFTPNAYNKPSGDIFILKYSTTNYLETSQSFIAPTNSGLVQLDLISRINNNSQSTIFQLSQLGSPNHLFFETQSSDSNNLLKMGANSNVNLFQYSNFQISAGISFYYQFMLPETSNNQSTNTQSNSENNSNRQPNQNGSNNSNTDPNNTNSSNYNTNANDNSNNQNN